MSKIVPCLWFDGKAEEAARFYVSLLPDSTIDAVIRTEVETPGSRPGSVLVVEFTLAGQSYLALNGGPHYQFTPAVSFSVSCADQAEIDRLWATLSDGGAPQQCGWVTDRYGVSWQVVPAALGRMMKDKDPVKVSRVMEALLQMGKLDIRRLQSAHEGLSAA